MHFICIAVFFDNVSCDQISVGASKADYTLLGETACTAVCMTKQQNMVSFTVNYNYDSLYIQACLTGMNAIKTNGCDTSGILTHHVIFILVADIPGTGGMLRQLLSNHDHTWIAWRCCWWHTHAKAPLPRRQNDESRNWTEAKTKRYGIRRTPIICVESAGSRQNQCANHFNHRMFDEKHSSSIDKYKSNACPCSFRWLQSDSPIVKIENLAASTQYNVTAAVVTSNYVYSYAPDVATFHTLRTDFMPGNIHPDHITLQHKIDKQHPKLVEIDVSWTPAVGKCADCSARQLKSRTFWWILCSLYVTLY